MRALRTRSSACSTAVIGCGPSTSARCCVPQYEPRRHRQALAAVSAIVTPSEKAAPAVDRFSAPCAGHFSPHQDSFAEEHRVRGAEVSPDQRANIVTIANLLQEVAGNHAVGMWGRADAGFANIPSMKELVFVMTRLQIRMDEYPKWGDIVRVETYFAEDGGLRARRDWNITDAETGQRLGVGTSSWVTINMATRRLSKLPEDVRTRFMQYSAHESRSALPAAETKQRIPDVVAPAQYTGPPLIARRSDMDMNGHVNNAVYLAWVLETVPQEVYNSCRLREIEVDFKAECKAGVTVQSLCSPVDRDAAASAASLNGNGRSLNFHHALFKCDDSKAELVRARSKYVPI